MLYGPTAVSTVTGIASRHFGQRNRQTAGVARNSFVAPDVYRDQTG